VNCLTGAGAFLGYRRPDGRVGTRNYVLVVPTVICASVVAERIAGPLEGPNQLAGYFDAALPLALAFAVDQPSLLAHVALFLMITTDVLTFSRGGIVGAIAGTATLAFVARRNLRAPFTAMGAGLATGLGVAVSWGTVAHTIGLERFWDFREPDYAGGVGTRPQLWRAAWTLWLRHPIFGVGAGNYAESYYRQRQTQEAIETPHSLELQTLSELGLRLLDPPA